MAQTIHRFKVNGTELNVHIEGQGPDVLLIHGFPDDSSVWRFQISALVEAGFRVIAPDTRGTGDSMLHADKKAYHIDNLVGDMIGLLDELKIEKVKLIAHDWGAAIAWNLVFQRPERFDRFVALSVGHLQAYGSAGFKQKLKAYYMMVFMVYGLIDWLLPRGNWWLFKLMMGNHPEQKHWIRQLSRPGRLKAALDYYRANIAMLIPQKWPRVQVPTLGLWSENDIALVESQMINTADYMDAPFEYHRVEGASHWLQLDKHSEINELLIDYLEKDIEL